MQNFTPGEWHVRKEHGLCFVESSKQELAKHDIAVPYGQEILGDDYFEFLDKEADCHLVAAAPAMYAKLQKLSTEMFELGCLEVSQEIETILAAARGETLKP